MVDEQTIQPETESDIQEAVAISQEVPVGEEFDYDFAPSYSQSVAVKEVPDNVASDLAAVTSATLGNSGVEEYEKVKSNIQSGDSEELLEAQNRVSAEQLATSKAVTMDLMADPSIPDGDKDQILLNAQAHYDELDFTVPSLHDQASLNMIGSNSPATYEAKTLGESMTAHADAYLTYASGIEEMAAQAADTIQLDGKTVIEGILMITPMYEGLVWRDWVENKLGSDWNNEAKIVVPGELREEIKAHIDTLTREGRFDEATEFFSDSLVYLRENAGVFGGNNFAAVTGLLSAYDEALGNTSPEDMDIDRWVLNAVGILDSIPYVCAAFKGIKAALRVKKASHMSRLAATNVEAATEVVKAAAVDEKVAEMVGETGDGLRTTYVLPKDAEFREINAPERLRESLLDVDNTAESLANRAEVVEDFSATNREAALAAESLRKKLSNVGEGKVWLGDSTLEKTTGGYRASAIVAASDESGWATLEAAEAANKKLFKGQGEVVSRRFHGEEYGTKGEKGEGHEEFFIKQESTARAVFMDDDYAVSVGGDKGAWFFDPDSRFHKIWSSKGNAVFEQAQVFTQQLAKHFEPATKLPAAGQIGVSKLLRVGNERGKVFSNRELRRYLNATGMNPKQVEKATEAYHSAREGFDTMYVLEDRIYRKSLVRGGYSHVTGAGDFNGFGKIVTDKLDVKFVYNPAKGEIEELADATGELIELRSAIRIDGIETKYVKTSDDVVVSELPARTLSYREGYVPKTYRENYFIEETYTILDHTGKSVERKRVLNATSSLLEGNNQRVKLLEKNPKGVYRVRHDRDMEEGAVEEAMSQMHHQTGNLFYSKRGEGVEKVGDEAANIVEPIEAGLNASRTIAKRTAMAPFIEDLKARWINTYSKYTNDGVFPSSADDVVSTDLAAHKEIKQAQSMHQWIKQLEGQQDEVVSFRRRAIGVADTLDRTSPKFAKIANAFRSVAGVAEPIAQARGLNFTLTLGTDPIRQLILQPSQILFTAALDPMTVVKNFRVGRSVSSVARRIVNKPMSATELDELGKGLGLPKGEFGKLVKQFQSSGLGSSITSHQLARDAAPTLSTNMSTNAGGRAAATALKGKDAALGFMRKGFERGEEINIGAHWMVARTRWMKNKDNAGKNPYSDQATLEIAGEARSIALSMTKAGDMKYQTGIMSLPMQFFSVVHKSLLAVATNKQFTRPERFRLAMGQLLQCGPAGLGLAGASTVLSEQFGVNLPEWFEDGMWETIINNSLSIATGEDVDADLSASFAPMSGVNDNILTMMGDSLSKDSFTPSDFIGPSKTVWNRISNAGQGMANLWNTDSDQVDMDAVRTLSADKVLSLISTYNRFAKGRAMLASDSWLDSHGRKLLPAGSVEATLHGFLGVGSEKVDRMYALTGMLGGRVKTEKTELQEVADNYYDQILGLTNILLARSEAGVKYPEIMAQHRAEVAAHNMLVNSLGPLKAEKVTQMVKARMIAANKGNKIDELYSSLGKLYTKGASSNPIKFAIDEGLVGEEEGGTLLGIYNFAMGIKE